MIAKFLRQTHFLFFFLLVLATISQAQVIELTAPLVPTTVKEGSDFAKSELGNPWDFQERRDIGWEEKYVGSSIKVEKGKWIGTFNSPGAYLFPLFGGLEGTIYAEGPQGDKTLPRFGINHSIDTSRYYLLSYRLRQSNRSSYAVYWNNQKTSNLWPSGNNFIARRDAFIHASRYYNYSGYNIYTHDLRNTSSYPSRAGSWSGKVYSLRLDPSLSGEAGSKTELDWIRLVDPTSAPELSIEWNADAIPAKSLLTLYLDTNDSDYDGTPIAEFSVADGSGSYTLPTAILPPGNYYFYFTVRKNIDMTVLARSNYSERLTINSTPMGYFVSPTTTSGEDYARSIVGDAWDMSNAEDLSNVYYNYPYPMKQFYWENFTNGKFNAVSDPYFNGSSMTDAQLHLHMGSTPIDTRKYRYLSYRMYIDKSRFADISDMVGNGFITRPVFWTQGIFVDGVTPPAHIVYEGWHTYVYDMKGTNAGRGLLFEGGHSYSESNSLSYMRIDPMETSIPTAFSFDWIKFTADNVAKDGYFNIIWSTSDSDNSRFTVSVYRDTDKKDFNGRLIATLSDVPSGVYSYSWNTKRLTNGTYYIYLKISDGTSTYKVYAPAPVLVGNTAPLSYLRTKHDYDGDGKSDRIIFRPATEAYFYADRSSRGKTIYIWGQSGDTPHEGDFDGDKKSDVTVSRVDGKNRLNWFIKRSTNRSLYNKIFGYSRDTPVIGDYNGDGKDDLALWRAGTWFVLYEDGQRTSKTWGAAGDIPMPQDYDGDGKTDLAVWRSSNRTWYIKNSGYASGRAPRATTTLAWGASGQTPVAGDFTGDGRADLGTFDPITATWYVRDVLNRNSFVSVVWGSPNDIPKVGDYNGDRIADLTAINSDTYVWAHDYRNGQTTTKIWGESLDLIP
ncbi:MAG: VCBS repeat-containing protein [Deltaproteobacteria bacterium]|nr:VCBS repeat-containing protein [Deltaproteobacteria bacterium]